MTNLTTKTNLDVNLEINLDTDRFCADPKKYLEMFKAHQSEQNYTDEKLGMFLLELENYLYHFANKLGGEVYNGGYWSMDKGFFLLSDGESDNIFQVSDYYGTSFKLNVTEFSIVANLFALSHLCIVSLDRVNPFTNHIAVFFSDYIKAVMNKNKDILNLSAIYSILD